VRELGRRSLAAALRRSSLDEIEAERKDPSNPQSVLYPAGGDLDLERYFAALADLDEHGNPPVAVLRGRRHAGTADVAARSMIVVLNLPVPDDRRVWAEACALLEAGDAVTVICPALRGHRPGWATVDGIDVRYFRTFEGGGSLSTVAEGLWTTGAATLIGTALLRRHPFDVVQVCNPPDSLGPFLRLAARTGARTVYDQHDVVPVLASEKISFRGAAKLFAAMERSTIRSAEVVISPSGEQARRIDDLYGRGVSVVRTASVEVAPRGTRPDVGPLRLGYLGVVGSQDGLDDAVRAVAETRARSNVDFEVRIAGDGPSLPSARALAAELGLQDTIRFVGWLDHARVGAFLEGIDAMLVPDPPTPFNHLCAMNKVTHAMAAGICIIYRPLRENLDLTGGLAYVAKGEGVGHFAEAIVQFLSAPPRERADVGAELAARFHKLHAWPVHKARYLEAVRGPVPAAPGVRSDA
jgi:glycosyltransferase involved in cell wall biosynthesis